MNPLRSRLLPSALAALLALPAVAGAQARAGATRDTVPVSMLPPAGKCRIWMIGVPTNQQPAATDCATALRQKPTNGVVLYGPAQRDAESERFDPKVGQDPRNPSAESRERRNGSRAEQEIERNREAAARARLAKEMRERDERARAESIERAANGTSSVRAPADARGGASSGTGDNNGRTASPRSTPSSTGSGSATPRPAERPPKPPAEAKKKPE